MVTTPVRVGLTGGIGSGKSTVAGVLEASGATIIDADAIARSMTAAGGAACPAIVAEFGADILDSSGALDRARMRELAYTDSSARKRLEAIIHPLVGQETSRKLHEATLAGATCVVFDIPLLVESGRWRKRLDWVLVVDCTAELQVERVMQRSGLQPAEITAIIASQAPRERRLAAADAVVFNAGLSLAELGEQVSSLALRFGLSSPVASDPSEPSV